MYLRGKSVIGIVSELDRSPKESCDDYDNKF